MDQLEFDKPLLARYGRVQFHRCVEFVVCLPYVKEAVHARELELDRNCSEMIFWKLKETLVKVVWGELFQKYFSCFFAKLKNKEEVPVKLKNEQRISSFTANNDGRFNPLDKFVFCLTTGEQFTAILKEDCIIKFLYNDPEFCVIFDMYSKAGTETIAESFYRVMETQENDGSQSQLVSVRF